MSLLEYCQILPEHLARKPSEKLNVKEGLISRLSQEIGCEQDFAEVISFLRQQTSIWSAEDINSFEAAARRGLLAAGGKKIPFLQARPRTTLRWVTFQSHFGRL